MQSISGSGSGGPPTPAYSWTWVGNGKKRNKCTYYEEVLLAQSEENRARIFETGHCVVLASTDKHLWVGQIIELYEVGVDVEDDEVHIVSDTTPQQMRCKLRWMYRANDKALARSRRASPHLPKPVENELYFSDHVEEGCNNSLESVDRRAFLCASEEELDQFHSNLPKDYWENDAVCLVRCFYGFHSGSPPPIRELRKGELEAFLRQPSKSTSLYGLPWSILYGRRGTVMKGTGKKRKFQRVAPQDTTTGITTAAETNELDEGKGAEKGHVESGSSKTWQPAFLTGIASSSSRNSQSTSTRIRRSNSSVGSDKESSGDLSPD